MIHIRGAREHNLKNISISIPRNKITVITGVSGSGKSSLAFDTIYAEGQRRYMESLSSYARQFLDQLKKPDVDSIDGLSAAIAIDQKSIFKNPRSTVGTATEIYDYLRLLYAKAGVAYCPHGHGKISNSSLPSIQEEILKLPQNTKIYVFAPLVQGRKGQFKKEIEMFQKKGFSKIRIDGILRSFTEKIDLKKNINHDLDLLVDQLILEPTVSARLQKSLDQANFISKGSVLIHNLDTQEDLLFNTKMGCSKCQFSFPELEPRFFSFNSPYGACPECEGLGEKKDAPDESLIIPNTSLSLKSGAIRPWNSSNYIKILESVTKHFDIPRETAWKKLETNQQNIILYGSQEKVSFEYERDGKIYTFKESFEGVVPYLKRTYLETNSEKKRERIAEYFDKIPCPSCGGERLKKEALSIKINDSHIGDVCNASISKAIQLIEKWTLTEKQKQIGEKIKNEILERLGFLEKIGLHYLTLSRSTSTLSTGEAQRIKLASQLGSYLTGVLYVLDEPSIGLHPRDHHKLLNSLKALKDLGNTLIIVEHDEDTILQADYLLDMGPRAGELGGKVVSFDTPQNIKKNKKSLTGQYLSGEKQVTTAKKLSEKAKLYSKKLTLMGVETRNLKNINVEIPLGNFICVTGVSGSGKSSLIMDTLLPHLNNYFYNSKIPLHSKLKSITGIENLDKVICVDQSPIGKTPRSNPATYTGIFAPLRDFFASLPLSKIRGFGSGRFSFNVSGGRCEMCEGAGMIKIEMHFLPNVFVQCQKCEGKRYNLETLQVTFKEKNIAEILDLTIDDASEVFKNIPQIQKKLHTLQEVGLGYIRLGQQAPTLSGGEAQRIKLAKELSKRSTGKTLYILDEPTTGLHFDDINKLLKILRSLVDQGNTVIVIEHQLDVVAHSDYIIDIGREGGEKGGEVVFFGPTHEILKNKNSHTGYFLKQKLL